MRLAVLLAAMIGLAWLWSDRHPALSQALSRPPASLAAYAPR